MGANQVKTTTSSCSRASEDPYIGFAYRQGLWKPTGLVVTMRSKKRFNNLLGQGRQRNERRQAFFMTVSCKESQMQRWYDPSPVICARETLCRCRRLPNKRHSSLVKELCCTGFLPLGIWWFSPKSIVICNERLLQGCGTGIRVVKYRMRACHL